MEPLASPIPPLQTRRLLLRAHQPDDVPAIVRICESIEVVRHTQTMPHPYTPDDARAFLGRIAAGSQRGETYCWLMTLKKPGSTDGSGEPVGNIGLKVDPEHRHADLGYVLAPASWGRGFATEAAAEVVRFAFETLALERVHATYFDANPASGRVLKKCGFTQEGLRPRMYHRFGEWKDAVLMRILRTEWQAQRGRSA